MVPCTSPEEVEACNTHLQNCDGEADSSLITSDETNEAYYPEKPDRVLSIYFFKEKGNKIFSLHDGSLRISEAHQLLNDITIHEDFLVGYGHATRKSDFKDLRSLSNADVHEHIQSIRNGNFCRIDVLKNSSGKLLNNPELPVSFAAMYF